VKKRKNYKIAKNHKNVKKVVKIYQKIMVFLSKIYRKSDKNGKTKILSKRWAHQRHVRWCAHEKKCEKARVSCAQ